MADKAFIVRFRPIELGIRSIAAARAEIHGEHLIFINAQGKLAALFLLNAVQSWNEVAVKVIPVEPV